MAYVSRRLATALFQILLITFITYFLFYIIASVTGASPAQRVAGRSATPERVAEVAHLLGTDLPWYEQYANFLGRLSQGDFGQSYLQRRPVADIIFPAALVTASLVFGAAVLWVLLAIPVGVTGAVWPRSLADRTLAVIVQLAIAAPVFWVAPMLSYLLAYQPTQGTLFGVPLEEPVSWLPIQGYVDFTDDPVEWARHLILPWTALALGFAGLYARFIRAFYAEQLSEDYVLTARAKGASEFRILRLHVGRIVAPAIMTLLGLDIGAVIGGALFVETTFGLPGLGYVAYSSIQLLDYPLTIGTITFAALMAVALNTVADLAQARLDPRVRK